MVEENPHNEYHKNINSPRSDLNSLSLMLIEFLHGLLPLKLNKDLKYDDKREITNAEYNVIFFFFVFFIENILFKLFIAFFR